MSASTSPPNPSTTRRRPVPVTVPITVAATSHRRHTSSTSSRSSGVTMASIRSWLSLIITSQGGEPTPVRRFVTAEYWRLYERFPSEMERATQPFVDVTERHLREGVEAGLLHSADPAEDAWLLAKMVMAIFHHRAFAPDD